MKIKVQCGCGAVLEFNEEPVDGRLPRSVFCLNCDEDLTGAANRMVAGPGAEPAGVDEVVEDYTVEQAAPPAPVSTGLRVSSSSGDTVAPVPSATTPTPSPEPSKPSDGGSGGLRIKGASDAPAAEPAPAKPAVDNGGEDLSAMYERKRKEAKAQMAAKQKAEAAYWRKVGIVSTLLCLLALVLVGVYFWYYFVGRKPRVYATVTAAPEQAVYAKLLGLDRLLTADANGLILHDLAKQKPIWETPLDYVDFYLEDGSPIHFTAQHIWILRAGSFHRINRESGTIEDAVKIPGSPRSVSSSSKALLVISDEGRKGTQRLTRIDLKTGEHRSTQASVKPTEFTRTSSNFDPSIDPTAARLVQEELEVNGIMLPKYGDHFIPAGDHLVHMHAKLTKPDVVTVDAMRPAGDSRLNSSTSASSDVVGIADDIFNEMKRAEGGHLRKVNKSIYRITIERLMAGNVPSWSGNVVGNHHYFALDTVDLLVDHENLRILDKKNNLLKTVELNHPIHDLAAEAGTPALELDNMLFFLDQGTMTAFRLPSCEEAWSLTTVFASRIQADSDGDLYVTTTTASPDLIDYPEQITIKNRPQPVLMKVDAGSGRKLWESEKVGRQCWITGEFLYSNRVSGNSLSIATGADTDRSTYYRINPRNGKRIWKFAIQGEIHHVDFFENRVLLVLGNQVNVMKYLTF